MKEKAQKWEFEQAAKIRDQIKALEELLLTL
jgi:protein-arginine kinase activator protein McsA